MREEEMFLFVVFSLSAVVGVPWLMFALASLFSGFPRLRLHQILGLVGVSAWIFAFLNALLPPFRSTGLLLFMTTVVVLLSFAGMWVGEFRLLMLRRADEFPDRFDKLAWIFVLTLMAPAGVWLFRSYRKARWPEPLAAVRPHPLDESEAGSGVEVSGMQRIGA